MTYNTLTDKLHLLITCKKLNSYYLEVVEQIHGGHGPPREEVLGHPFRVGPGLGVKAVREVSVTQDL